MKECSFTAICMILKAPYNKYLVCGLQSKNVRFGWKHTANIQSNKSPPTTRHEASLYLLDEY
jgi:hypothetical protein